MLCGTAGCTEGAKMSGSAGKMGGAEMKEGLKSSLLNKVKVTDKFWRGYQELVMDTVIPYQEKILNDEIPGVEKSHALANFRIAAGLEEGEFYGMVFQDSDVAKWLEGVAYALEVRPDDELEECADKVIEIIEKAMEKGLTSGRGPTGVAAAALYIASVLLGERKTQRDVADIAGVTEVTIRNRYKELTEQLEMGVTL